MDKFERIFERVRKKPPSDPFSHYKIKNFQERTEIDREKFFVNFETEIEKLVGLIMTFNPSEKKNRRIALIGPSGSGKTTLMNYFFMKLSDTLRQEKYRGELEWAKFLMRFSAKNATATITKTNIDTIRDTIKKNMDIDNSCVMAIDDLHEVFISDDNNQAEQYIKLMSDKGSIFFITTWLPYGWSYATSKYPDLKNIFDEVIFIEGLTIESCKEMLEKRFERCLEDDSRKPYGPFTEDSVKRILDLGWPNPRMIITLISESIKLAYEEKAPEIKNEIVDKVAKKLGQTTQSFDSLSPTDKHMLTSCLAATTLSTKEIQHLTGKERSNISTYMNDLVRRGFFEKEMVDNHSVFTMTPFIRYDREKELMKEVKLLFAKK